MKYVPPVNGDTTDPDRGWPNADPANGIEGAIPDGAAIEHPLRELDSFILLNGLTPSDEDLFQVSRAVRARRLNYFAAGGTVNAITIDMADLEPASWAELEGAPLLVVLSAANTSTAVTIAPTGLTARAIVYNDGSLPRPGDLVGPMEFTYVASLDKVVIVSSSRTAGLNVRRSQLVASRGTSSQLTPTDVATRVTNFGSVASYFDGGSTFSSGVLTIGAGDAGLWYISAHQRQTFSSTSGAAVALHLNGASTPVVTDGASVAAGGPSVSHASASRVMPLAAGDELEMRLIQTTGADFTFNDLYSFTATRLGTA